MYRSLNKKLKQSLLNEYLCKTPNSKTNENFVLFQFNKYETNKAHFLVRL